MRALRLGVVAFGLVVASICLAISIHRRPAQNLPAAHLPIIFGMDHSFKQPADIPINGFIAVFGDELAYYDHEGRLIGRIHIIRQELGRAESQ